MSRMLSDDDIEAIVLKLTELSGLSPEEHKEHHEALQMFIEDRKIRIARNEKIVANVGGWAIIGVLGAVGSFVWHLVLASIERGN